jgi:hypothetical protein
MNSFRFVWYTWCCAVILYPISVMTGDILTRSNTDWKLFMPLLALAFVGGLPGLLMGTLTLQWLRLRQLAPALQYGIWCGSGFLALGLLFLGPLQPLLSGDAGRFIIPLVLDLAVVLSLRYSWFRELPVPQF